MYVCMYVATTLEIPPNRICTICVLVLQTKGAIPRLHSSRFHRTSLQNMRLLVLHVPCRMWVVISFSGRLQNREWPKTESAVRNQQRLRFFLFSFFLLILLTDVRTLANRQTRMYVCMYVCMSSFRKYKFRQACAAAVWWMFPRMRRDKSSQITFPSNKATYLRQLKGRAYKEAMDNPSQQTVEVEAAFLDFGNGKTHAPPPPPPPPLMRLEFERGLPLLLGIKMPWVLFDGVFRRANTGSTGTLTMEDFMIAFGTHDPDRSGNPISDARSPSKAGSEARASSIKALCGGLEMSGMGLESAMGSVDVGAKGKLSLAELIGLFRMLNVQPPRKHAHALLMTVPAGGRVDKFVANRDLMLMVETAYDDAEKHIQSRITESAADPSKLQILKKRLQQLRKAQSVVLGVASESLDDAEHAFEQMQSMPARRHVSVTERPQAISQDIRVLEEYVELLSEERKAKDDAIDEMLLYAKRLKLLVSNQGQSVERNEVAEMAAHKSLARMKSRAVRLRQQVSNKNPGDDLLKQSLQSEVCQVALRNKGRSSKTVKTSKTQNTDAQVGLLLSFVEQLETDISDKDLQSLALTKRVVKLVNMLSGEGEGGGASSKRGYVRKPKEGK
jgi:hypothetical protein